jgi:hypothetical protein
MEEIRSCAGSQFDPEVVEAFLSVPREDLKRIRARRADSLRRTRTLDADRIADALDRVKAQSGA